MSHDVARVTWNDKGFWQADLYRGAGMSIQMLERAARAVAKANGYHYAGDSILANAEENPRAADFVAIARAVMDAVLPLAHEACAKTAEAAIKGTDNISVHEQRGADKAAAAIRARSNS